MGIAELEDESSLEHRQRSVGETVQSLQLDAVLESGFEKQLARV